MLFCDKAAVETNTSASTTDAGKVRTGGGFRPAASKGDAGKAPVADTAEAPATADAGKVRLGGGFRPAADTTDAGKVRLGGGFRLTTPSA